MDIDCFEEFDLILEILTIYAYVEGIVIQQVSKILNGAKKVCLQAMRPGSSNTMLPLSLVLPYIS